MQLIKKLYHYSVFNPMRVGSIPPTMVIAMLFHRTAATVYLMYALWGIVTGFGTSPTLDDYNSELFSNFFSLFAVLTTIPAAIGATFFPRTGRLEMYAASAFTGLMLVYLAFGLGRAITGESHWGSIILLLSILVIPIARFSFILLTLVRTQANGTEGE